MGMLTIDAEPGLFAFDPRRTALVMIDMQRDFIDHCSPRSCPPPSS